MVIGGKIREARLARNLTQKELGVLCGMADSAIRRYESNRGNPTAKTIQRIADALGVSVAYLEGTESMETRAIMDAIDRKDSREFERLLGLPVGSIVDMSPDLKDCNQFVTVGAHDNAESDRQVEYLQAFARLNSAGQQRAIECVKELAEIPRYQRSPNQPDGKK